jgi:hypothetical protein
MPQLWIEEITALFGGVTDDVTGGHFSLIFGQTRPLQQFPLKRPTEGTRWAAARRHAACLRLPLFRACPQLNCGQNNLQLPLKRPIQRTWQQRIEFHLRLRLQLLQRIDLGLQPVDAKWATPRRCRMPLTPALFPMGRGRSAIPASAQGEG